MAARELSRERPSGARWLGVLVGNEIEKRSRREDEDYRISVRNGRRVVSKVIVAENPHLRVGDRQLRKAITATVTAIVSTMPLG